MTDQTPIQGMDAALICTKCQQAALERLRNKPGVAATFQYCDTTHRAPNES